MERVKTHLHDFKRINKGPFVGFTLSQATKALRESRDIALFYFRPLH